MAEGPGARAAVPLLAQQPDGSRGKEGALWSVPVSDGKIDGRKPEGSSDADEKGSSLTLANGVMKTSLSAETGGEQVGPVVTEREMHVVASIEEWNRGLTSSALDKKFQMLGQSPVAFFSGTNHLFWADLSGDPHLTKFGNAKTTTWICGNCTYLAFASSGSDTEGPLYGIDSFEESLIADYQYDVWRLAVSLALLVRERLNYLSQSKEGHEGATTATESLEQLQAFAVKAMAQGYLAAVFAYRTPGESSNSKSRVSSSSKQNHSVDKNTTVSVVNTTGKLTRLLSLTGGNAKGVLVRFLAVVERDLSRRKLIKRWCGDVSNVDKGAKASFLTRESVEPSPQYEADAVVSALGAQYADGVNVKALARRLNVSAATCGAPRFVALTEAPDGELHILDICMQQRPTAYHFMNPGERSAYLLQYKNEAQRYATACQALAVADESSTSWISLDGPGVHPAAVGCYSVRDCSPFHEQYPVSSTEEGVKSKLKGFGLTSREAVLELSETWGRILGIQHCYAAGTVEEQYGPPLAAGSQPTFAKEISFLVKEHNGGFEELASQIAVAYSRQVVHDWQVFLRLVLSREKLQD